MRLRFQIKKIQYVYKDHREQIFREGSGASAPWCLAAVQQKNNNKVGSELTAWGGAGWGQVPGPHLSWQLQDCNHLMSAQSAPDPDDHERNNFSLVHAYESFC